MLFPTWWRSSGLAVFGMELAIVPPDFWSFQKLMGGLKMGSSGNGADTIGNNTSFL
ncbi:hypothetical protein AMTR_s00015p00236510, partial [Amborella trichopoda]